MRINELQAEQRLFEQFDPSMIDQIYAEIVQSGTMSLHGTDLAEFVQSYEHDDQWWSGTDPSIARTPQFLTGFREWLNHRFKYAVAMFQQEFKSAGGRWPCPIRRSMRLTRPALEKMMAGKPVGVFWAINAPGVDIQPYQSKSNAPEYILHSKAPKNAVNWIETLRSRMDYINGDREAELQLISGARIRIDKIEQADGSFLPVKPFWSQT
jgi:hypothetical protein